MRSTDTKQKKKLKFRTKIGFDYYSFKVERVSSLDHIATYKLNICNIALLSNIVY